MVRASHLPSVCPGFKSQCWCNHSWNLDWEFLGFISKFVVLHCAFCKLWRIFGFSLPSIILADLLGNTCLGHGLWFAIGGFWSVLFRVQGSLLCDRPVSGNDRLVKFASQIFLIFLILVTCKNKSMFASFLQQKIFSPSQFPSLLLNSLESFLAKLGEHVIVISINLAFTKMIDRTENPKSLRSLQYAQHDTTNFAVI